ncbi:hypothetical protein [Nocardia sp. XZ_19_385]|uniref:hypothetical protein n=1 Tax=Nocardia sp. XZ_19_385 TaxID=2769488 RepID=UPI00188F3BF1|nr:hypothetical protein [Nocardia sp. XZ_19_385]
MAETLNDTAALHRLGGVAGLIGGTAIAVAGLTELAAGHKTGPTQLLNGVAVPFGIGLLVALYLTNFRALGRFGVVAFTVQFLGFGYFAGVAFTRNFVLVYLEKPVVDELLNSPAKSAFLATAVTALAGTLLFGAALLRSGVVPRVAAGLYTAGLAALCLTFLLPPVVVRTGHIAAGAAMIWLAVTVWRSGAPRPPATLE